MLVLFQTGGANFDAFATGLGRQSGPLEIGLFAGSGNRVVFGGAHAVGVATDHLTAFVANRTGSHKFIN